MPVQITPPEARRNGKNDSPAVSSSPDEPASYQTSKPAFAHRPDLPAVADHTADDVGQRVGEHEI